MTIIRWILIGATLLAAYLAALVVLFVPFGWAGGVLLVASYPRRRGSGLSAHGTARWAAVGEIRHLLRGDGLIVGRIRGKPTRLEGLQALFDANLPARDGVEQFLESSNPGTPEYVVRLTNAVHTAVFAPTGVGKGVSFVIPHLLTCPDSCVVVDFKGENYRLTAAARKKMGQRIVVLDPFKVVTAHPDSFNPLAFIGGSDTAVDDCRDLAEALVVRTGQEKEPHWCDAAELWIAAMTATVVAFAENADRNLQSVRALLTNPEKMQAAVEMMCGSELWQGMLARLGYQLTQFKDKELGSTLTTTNRFLRFLDTIAVSDGTRKTTFDPNDLLKGRMTIYLVLPPDRMRSLSALLRMWIGGLLRVVVKRARQGGPKVHFVLDEAASLGHMPVLDDAVDKYRHYGVRLQFYYQSLGQLKLCWPEGRDLTLLSNVSQVFFGVNDQQTAEYVSNRLGEGTIVVASGGTGWGRSTQQSSQGPASHGSSYNASDNWQQVGRRLLKPEEVTALDPDIAVVLHPGVRPLATRLIPYYSQRFRTPRRIGVVRAAVDAVSLFLIVAVVVAMLTTGIFYEHWFR